jgi:aspartyl-tRNA(Asn)/glutamyl-tRNA(Gln) amidotransferase subunit A
MQEASAPVRASKVSPVELTRACLALGRTVIRAEAYAYHAEYIAKTPELYLPETLAKLQLGAAIDGQTYIRARRDLDRLRRSAVNVFSSVDVLVTPTARSCVNTNI